MLTDEQTKKIQTFILNNYEEEMPLEEIQTASAIGLAFTSDEEQNIDIQVTLHPDISRLITTIRMHDEEIAVQKVEVMSDVDWEYITQWDFDGLTEELYQDVLEDDCYVIIPYEKD